MRHYEKKKKKDRCTYAYLFFCDNDMGAYLSPHPEIYIRPDQRRTIHRCTKVQPHVPPKKKEKEKEHDGIDKGRRTGHAMSESLLNEYNVLVYFLGANYKNEEKKDSKEKAE